MKQLPIAIGYCAGGTVRQEFCDSLIGVYKRYEGMPRISVKSGPRISSARNSIVRGFLNDTDKDYLLMLDSDMAFRHDLPEKLLNGAQEDRVIGGLCFSRDSEGLYPVMFDSDYKVRKNYPRNSLVEVGATGAACLLIPRQVLAHLGETGPLPHPWFQEEVIDEFEWGEDVTFCRRARRLGYQVFVNTACALGHVKESILTEEMFIDQRRARHRGGAGRRRGRSL